MSIDTVDRFETTDSWRVQYLQDHAIHIAVVLVFLAYPFVYDVLVDLFALTAEMVLPEPRTMLMIFVLGLFAISFDFVSGYTGYFPSGTPPSSASVPTSSCSGTTANSRESRLSSRSSR